MRELIHRMLVISNKEDFLSCNFLINIIIVIISSSLSFSDSIYTIIIGHTVALLWVSATTCQLFNLYIQKRVAFLWCESPMPKYKHLLVLFFTAVIQNSLLLLFVFLQLIIWFKATVFIALITALIHFLYAVALGAMLAAIFKNSLGILVVVLYYTFCYYLMGQFWTHMEPIHIISPIIQLLNVHRLNSINVISLTMVTVLCFVVCFGWYPISSRKSMKQVFSVIVCAVLLVSVGFYEEYHNQKVSASKYSEFTSGALQVSYRAIDRFTVEQYADMLHDLDRELSSIGVSGIPTNHLMIQKYSVAPYLSASRIPFLKDENTLYINIFSDAMMNLEDTEICYEMMERIVKQALWNDGEKNRYLSSIFPVLVADIIEETIKNASVYSFTSEAFPYSQMKLENILQQELVSDNKFNSGTALLLTRSQKDFQSMCKRLIRENPDNEDEAMHLLQEHLI